MSTPKPSNPFAAPPSQPPPAYEHHQKAPQNDLHQVPLGGPPRNRADRFDYMEDPERGGRHNDYWEWRYNNPDRAECMRQTFVIRLAVTFVVFIVVGVIVGVVVHRRHSCDNSGDC